MQTTLRKHFGSFDNILQYGWIPVPKLWTKFHMRRNDAFLVPHTVVVPICVVYYRFCKSYIVTQRVIGLGSDEKL